MKKAFIRSGFIMNEDDFAGIHLGYSLSMEHTMGTARLESSLGLDPNRREYGICTTHPALFLRHMSIEGIHSLLLVCDKTLRVNFYRDLSDQMTLSIFDLEPTWSHKSPVQKLYSSWDDSSFGFLAVGEEHVSLLEQFIAELDSGNMCFLSSSEHMRLNYGRSPMFIRSCYLRRLMPKAIIFLKT